MAIQKADPGGEYYFSVGVNAGGVWNAQGNASCANNAPAGRSTLYGINLGTNGFVEAQYSTAFSELIVAGALYIPAGAFTNNAIFMQWMDGASNQVELRVNSAGNLYFTRNNTVIGSTSSNALLAGSGWHYFEAQVKIHLTAGTAQVWVDNVSWLSGSSLVTQATGNATANRTRWSFAGANTGYWKDMVCVDTGTGANTSRLGDVQVGVIYPNAAGTNQQFSNTGGASQTVSVQDGIAHAGTWPDGDTTYISDSVSGHISDFAHQTLGAGTLYGIVHASYARSDAGAANFQQWTKSGATIHTSASLVASGSYNYYFDVEETDPNTSAQWTVANFNSATFGVKIP